MEPQNCTARVDGDAIEFWAPTQSPFGVFLAAVKGAGFKPENVKINVTFLGGGFGRRAENDYAVDAALIAQRGSGQGDQDHLEPRGRRALHQAAAAHGAAPRGGPGPPGQPHRPAVPRWSASRSTGASRRPRSRRAAARICRCCEGAYEPTYHYPNFSLEQLLEARGVDVAVWRSVGGGYTKFALETFIEEVAPAAGKDPIEFRLKLLEKEPRGQTVIREAMAHGRLEPQASGRARARPRLQRHLGDLHRDGRGGVGRPQDRQGQRARAVERGRYRRRAAAARTSARRSSRRRSGA